VIASLFLYSSSSSAQQSKLARIGVLWPGDVEHWNKAFLDALSNNGFKHGTTAEIFIRSTGSNFNRGAQLAQELVQLNPDVVYAASELLAKNMVQAARAAGKAIPIVVTSWDPVAEGLVESAAHPGGNVTGLGGEYAAGALLTKHLQLIRQMFPRVKRVACLVDVAWNSDVAVRAKTMLKQSAPKLGLQLTLIDVQSAEDLERVFNQILSKRVGALLVQMGTVFAANRIRIIEFTSSHRIPTIYGDELFAHDGGLISYGMSIAAMQRGAADMVAKILHGTKPAEIPVEYGSRFLLIVNQRTAKAQGVTVPSDVLLQADELIK